MQIMLMIVGGIVLAMLLLPLLGPIAVVAVSFVVLVLILFSFMTAIAAGKAMMDEAKAASANSFRTKVKSSEDFRRGVTAGVELLERKNLMSSPAGVWYRYIINKRLQNCYKLGAFRVEDGINRKALETCLEKAVNRGGADSAAETLAEEILECHDSMCRKFLKNDVVRPGR